MFAYIFTETMYDKCQVDTLPKTNIALEKMGIQGGKQSSNHQFPGDVFQGE